MQKYNFLQTPINIEASLADGYENYLNQIRTYLAKIEDEALLQTKDFTIYITEDGIKTARSFVADIRKTAKAIDSNLKDVLLCVESPIKELKSKAKTISTLLESVANDISSNIELLLADVRSKITELTNAYKLEMIKKHNLEPDYQNFTLKDYSTALSNLTDTKESLTNKVKDEIESVVAKQKLKNLEANLRLESLKNICIQNEIQLLEKTDVKDFLHDEVDLWNSKLNELVEKTKAKEEKIKADTIAKFIAETEVKKQPIVEKIETKTNNDKNILFTINFTIPDNLFKQNNDDKPTPEGFAVNLQDKISQYCSTIFNCKIPVEIKLLDI
jgi:hypothetical protein